MSRLRLLTPMLDHPAPFSVRGLRHGLSLRRAMHERADLVHVRPELIPQLMSLAALMSRSCVLNRPAYTTQHPSTGAYTNA